MKHARIKGVRGMKGLDKLVHIMVTKAVMAKKSEDALRFSEAACKLADAIFAIKPRRWMRR